MIFLHSSWRSASTYVWSRFREAPHTVAYYEIFHEALAGIVPEWISNVAPSQWHSKHPPGAPYFLEFLPVLKEGGGVEHFDPSMTTERFIPEGGCGGDISAGEVTYVGALIRQATERGKVPVLTETRSLGRARGLKRTFGGLHALIYRNVFHQWCSFTDQLLHGNPYFIDRMMDVLRAQSHDATLRDLLKLFPIGQPSMADPDTFYLFVFFHLHLYVQSVGAMDCVLDIHRLEHDAVFRKQVEDQIAAEGDVAVDLSGIRNTMAYSACEFTSRAEFLQKMNVLGDMVVDQAPDEAGRVFGRKVLSDLLEEHERHDFHASALRSVLFGPAGMQAERDALRAVRDQAVLTEQQLRSACDAAEGAAASVAMERDRVQGERDAALAQAEALQSERDGAVSDRDRLQSERDAALAQCEALLNERESVLARCETLGGERDRAVSARGRVRDERDAAIALLELARADGDQAASALDRLQVELDAVLAQCDALREEHDRLVGEHAASMQRAQGERDAMAASLGWRLTNPLRRLGIGTVSTTAQ